MSLDQLITGCKKNDAKAQSQLYKLYASKLFSLSLKYSRNYADAEDNLQDAFIAIFKKIGQFNSKGSLEGWMKRITVNTVLQKYRSVAGVYDISNSDQIKDDYVAVDEDAITVEYLLECIQNLPDRYRLVFNLYALDGHSHKEISEMLDITTGTSKSNLARARMILKEKIEQYQAARKSQIL